MGARRPLAIGIKGDRPSHPLCSTDLQGDLAGELVILLGVDLGYFETCVAERGLGGFEAEFVADLGPRRVAKLLRGLK